MRRSTIVVVFLMLLLAGCGANTTTESTRESTGDTTARSAQSEATIRVTAVPEKTTSATVAPAGWVSAIGDSVMLGAVEALQQEIPNLSAIDAQGCLQTPAAIQILRERRAAGQLGDVVVVHIGNNGPLSADIFDEMMQVLAGVRKILVVNLTVPPNVSDPVAVPNNAVLAAGVQRYPMPRSWTGTRQAPVIPNSSGRTVSTSRSRAHRPTPT